MSIGDSIRRLEVVESTNSLLKAEAELGRVSEGAVVVADHQTAGRGRLDRQWESPPGLGLLFSALLMPNIPKEQTPLISLAASLAVMEGLRDTVAIGGLQLKWPNDVLHEGSKLCGILCEAGVDNGGRQFVVVGIGLNVSHTRQDFPDDLVYPATSLKIITDQELSREAILRSILHSLDRLCNRVKAEGADWIAENWLDQSGLAGKSVTVARFGKAVSGTVDGLQPDGALRLRLQSGEIKTIHSGDVT